jgi:hypothetical protein
MDKLKRGVYYKASNLVFNGHKCCPKELKS